jgi:hypothetical protein
MYGVAKRVMHDARCTHTTGTDREKVACRPFVIYASWFMAHLLFSKTGVLRPLFARRDVKIHRKLAIEK